MLVYNTLTNKKEELKTVNPGEVRMYSCGPTVYNFAHIGNLRTYVFMDILRFKRIQKELLMMHLRKSLAVRFKNRD